MTIVLHIAASGTNNASAIQQWCRRGNSVMSAHTSTLERPIVVTLELRGMEAIREGYPPLRYPPTTIPELVSFRHSGKIKPRICFFRSLPLVVIPVTIYRSAQGPRSESAPTSALRVILAWLRLASRVSRVSECQKALLRALFGALRARCLKSLEKHSLGHLPAWALWHSCGWRPGTQSCDTDIGIRIP